MTVDHADNDEPALSLIRGMSRVKTPHSPRCGGCAVSRILPSNDQCSCCGPRRLVCLACGHADTWQRGDGRSRFRGVVIRRPLDPHFRRPLWLQASCCGGKTLWAWNVEHLDVLEGYIGTQLRERGAAGRWAQTSMLEKLPTWMKTAKNRDEILKVIGRLRATLPDR